MGNVRRWYVYLVSAVTLQAVTWAVINLLRNLIIPGVNSPTAAIAFQISVIVIGLPPYLAHWLWVQRKAANDLEERAAFVRLLYLYAMMTAFLIPIVNNVFHLTQSLLQLVFNVTPSGYAWERLLPASQNVWYNLVPIIILGLLWFYHRRVRVSDEKVVPAAEAAVVVRQIYIYLFTGIGLVLGTLATINMLRWLFTQLFPAGASPSDVGRLFLAAEIARLAVGLTLWLVFWLYAQRLFSGPDEQERESVVRKAYLYLVIFASVMTVVTTVAIILADVLHELMDVPTSGGDVRAPISVVLITGAVWAYHAYVLRQDAAVAVEKEQQASVRRLYLYLTAGIGLAAVLIGLAGDLSVLIRALSTDSGFIIDLREQLGWFTAVLLAGLPLWFVNWWRAQKAATNPDIEGQVERGSLARRIYLYLYLFVATMVILGSAVYILSQIVELALEARSGAFFVRDVGQALAFMIIALAVWLYHGSILRRESRLAKEEEAKQLRPLRVAIIDAEDGTLGHALMEQIHQLVPSAQVRPLGLSSVAATAMNGSPQEESPEEVLSEAEVIVGPWNMAVAGSAGGLVSESIASSVASSPAHKILIPVRELGWEWTGVERWKTENIVKEATETIKQMAVGQDVKSKRRLSAVNIILIILGVLFFLTILIPVALALILSSVMGLGF